MALSIGELVGYVDLNTEGAEQGMSRIGGMLGGAGSTWGKLLGAAGVFVGGAFAASLVGAINLEPGRDRVAAALNLTAPQAKRAGDVAGGLYADAWGESAEDVNVAVEAVMSSIRGMRNASEGDLRSVTESAMTVADAFGVDVTRAAQVAGNMVTSGIAKDGSDAFDLLATAMSKVPAQLREDVMDATDEYGTFFNQLGISGPEAMGMLAAGAKKGMYGIDKTGDALKELTIRATDMSTSSAEAYESMGMDAQTMANRMLKGGKSARGATDDIVNGLLGIKDPAEQSQAAIALFGTPLEDLGARDIPKFLEGLKSGAKGMGDYAGATERMGDTLNDNAATNLKSFTRQLQTGVVNLIGGKVLPTVTELTGELSDNLGPAMDKVGDAASRGAGFLSQHSGAAKVLAGVLAAFLIPNLILTGITAIKSAVLSVRAWVMQQVAAARTVAGMVIAGATTVATWIRMGAVALLQGARMAAGWVLAMGPIGWVIAAVIGLAVLIFKNWDRIKATTVAVFGAVAGFLGTAWARIKTVVGNAVAGVVAFVRKHWRKIIAFLLGPLGIVVGLIVKHWDKIKSTTSSAIGRVVGFVKAIPGRFKGALSNLGSILRTVFGNAMDRAKDRVTTIGTTVVSWIKGIPGKLLNLASGFGNAGKKLLQKFIDGMKNAAGIIQGIAGNIWDGIRGMMNNAIDAINRAIPDKIGKGKLSIDLPDNPFPRLATGGRATDETLAVIGEGREPESVLPDSVLRGLLERAHAAGRSEGSGHGDGRGAPLIGQVIQGARESADELAERLWFKTRTRG